MGVSAVIHLRLPCTDCRIRRMGGTGQAKAQKGRCKKLFPICSQIEANTTIQASLT